MTSNSNLEKEGEVQKSKDKIWLRVIIWMAVLIGIGIGFLSVGIYLLGWNGPAIRKIESVIPFPAVVVSGRIITLDDFWTRFDAYKSAIEFNQSFDFSDPQNSEIIQEQKNQLLERMIDLKLEQLLALKYNISVSQQEIDAELNQLASGAGITPEDFDTVLANIYGWTKADFIEQVVVPQIIERKLQVRVVEDQEVNGEARERAETVLARLAAGDDFADLAQELSDDSASKELGGDLGWAPRGYFVKEFEDAVFQLEPGERSGIVSTQFGFHIIELLERTEEEGKVTMVHPRHILIAANDFSQWLEEQKQNVTVWRLPVN